MKRKWTRGEKALFLAPILVGVAALALQIGPNAARRAMGWPQTLSTLPDTQLRTLISSGNGEVLAAGGVIDGKKGWKRGSGTVYLWSARTLKRVGAFPPSYTRDKRGFTNGWDVYGLTLSPDAKTIGFSRLGQNFELHDVATKRLLWRFPNSISGAEFSPDGRFISLLGSANVSIVGAKDGQVKARIKRNSLAESRDVAWSPDGTTLAVIGTYKKSDHIYLHRASDGKLVRRIQSEETRSLAWSPDGQKLIVASSPINYKSEAVFNSWTPVRCFNPKSGALLWSAKASGFSGKYPQSSAAFCDAIFSPDGSTVAAYQYIEGRVFLLDSASGVIKDTLHLGKTAHSNFYVPPALAFSPDGNRLFARGKDAVLVWDLK